MRIAHLSDPHINLKYHLQHLPRLRRTLEHALHEMQADHIIITGDLTSNADARDLRTVRRLFESLAIMKSSKLTVVVGNHDIYGGPHLAEEVLSFPERCRTTDYDEKLAIFQDTFAELFTDTITMSQNGYPFLKRVGKLCLLGFNSIAPHSYFQNPVGSNGVLDKRTQMEAAELGSHHAWTGAEARIVLLHHHLFRGRDIEHLEVADGLSSGLAAKIELRTLRLHGKRHFFKLLQDIGTDMVLHGHVHFTGQYQRKRIPVLNGAGAVYPVFRSAGYWYNLIDVQPKGFKFESVDTRKPLTKSLQLDNTPEIVLT